MVKWVLFVNLLTLEWIVEVQNVAKGFTYQVNGANCNSDGGWYRMDERLDGFLVCDRLLGIYTFHRCPTINGVQKLFDVTLQQCVYPKRLQKRASGVPHSSGVGEPCYYNTDCMSTMRCLNGACACINSYIAVGQDCKPMINPGQSGCVSNEQCRIVWPGTLCVGTVCRCDLDMLGRPSAPVTTKDGIVCVVDLLCPLPQGVAYQEATPVLSLTIDMPELPYDQCLYESSDTEDYMPSCTFHNPIDTSIPTNYLGDLYDCIPRAPLAEPKNKDGFCCPNRAMTCIQPKPVSTSETNVETRYWFNSITGQCESFMWNSLLRFNSANAFVTLEHCMLYCGTTCRHAPVQYAPSSRSPALENKPVKCFGGGQCRRVSSDLTFQCTTVGNEEMCCASTESICSRSGGRDYGTPGMVQFATNYDPGYDIDANSPPVSEAETRYYYDITTKRCQSFIYGGYGGNFNNFLTNDDCLTFCSKSEAKGCGRGDPLKDSSGVTQTCAGQSRCPSTYECRSNMCCQTKQTICSQPKLFGSGCAPSSSSSRFWYNVMTRECENFQYNGCNGNDNNFETTDACIKFCQGTQQEPKCQQGIADKDSSNNFVRCTPFTSQSGCRMNFECVFDGNVYGCCPSKSFTCSLRPNAGIACGPPTTRWYFDYASKTCATMTFLGCDGNSNNFASRDQCQGYCVDATGCPFGGRPFQEESSSRPRICSANITTSSSSCPFDYFCSSISFGGNFIDACCPSRARLCSEFPHSGTACLPTPIQRYHYNVIVKRCQSFTYLGCDGNNNNFKTMTDCRSFCGAAACDVGEIAIMDPTAEDVRTCNVGSSSSCPDESLCKSDSTTGGGVCCGSPDPERVCSTSERPYLDALSALARTCDPANPGSCPSKFSCRPNTQKGKYYCCAPKKVPVAPECLPGQVPYRELTSGAIRGCLTNIVNDPLVCPLGYYCQFVNNTGAGLCCGVKGGCPGNSVAQVDPISAVPLICVPGSESCGIGYDCLKLDNVFLSVFGCCTMDIFPIVTTTTIIPLPPVTTPITTGPPVCPRGTPLRDLYSANGFQMCSPSFYCPTDYECVNTVLGYTCCPTQKIVCLQPMSLGTLCGMPQLRYYFDQSSSSCQSFFYNGCGGNDNNFVSLRDCEYCLEGMCPKGKPLTTIGGTIFSCSNDASLCGSRYECRTPLYGSVSFRLCCPRWQTYCTLTPDSGLPCFAEDPVARGSLRYFYDPSAGQCQIFRYYGCGGNGNRFTTRADCAASCRVPKNPITTGDVPYCPSGWTVFQDTLTSAPRSCLRSNCPLGFSCRFSPWRYMYFCCSPYLFVTNKMANKQLQPPMPMTIQLTWPLQSGKHAGPICKIPHPHALPYWVNCSPQKIMQCSPGYQCGYDQYKKGYRCCILDTTNFR